MKKAYIISEQTAHEQLDLFYDWYGIDYDEMLEAARQSQSDGALKLAENKVLKAIRYGAIEISEVADSSGEQTLSVLQRLARPVHGREEIEYKEVTGKARIAMKSNSNISDAARMYHFLGVLCGQGAEMFMQLRGRDIGVTDALGFLFLLV
jgi:hypothetical protein